MSKVLFITATPTRGGNGDALISAALEMATKQGAEIHRVDIRDQDINFCQACYKCSQTGICVQKDDFKDILALIHESDAIIAEAPIYYNCMSAQMITLVNRLCCTFACKNYVLGPKKKVGVMLTCTGSDPEEMKRHVRNITSLPSVARAIRGEMIEVFTNCNSDDTCKNSEEYLKKAREIATWACN